MTRMIRQAVLSISTIAVLVLLRSSSLVAQNEGEHVHQAADPQPYADLLDQEIKALSAKEKKALLDGEGMGLALAAELNGYPGPKHVLELADALALSEEERGQVERVFAEMRHEAVEIGERIVELERELDTGFAEATIDVETLWRIMREIGILEGGLRATHLEAHLAIVGVLSEERRMRYNRLRGYAGR